MDTFDVIRTRRSIRAFSSKKIPDQILYAILDAGHHAPAAWNKTNWRFLVIETEESKEVIAKAALGQNWIAHAPAVIIVCSDPTSIVRDGGERAKKLYQIQNTSAAIENILLAAHNFGISSCWVGAFTEPLLRKAFKIPDFVEIHAIIPLGHGLEKGSLPRRAATADVTFFDTYGELERGYPQRPLSEHIAEKKGKLKEHAKRAIKSLKEKVKRKVRKKK